MVDILGHTYYTSLPEEWTLCKSMVEIYKLRERKKKYCLANLELHSIDILLFSAYSKRYYSRPCRASSVSNLRTFVREWILYIPEERSLSTARVSTLEAHLMIEYIQNNKSTVSGYETKIKLLKKKL